MDVALLGPLEVRGPGGRVSIDAAKERLLLALLILRADAVVSRDALVDALWADEPPATAVKTLQGYVARVRRSLEAVGLAGAVVTRDPGYVLGVSPGSTDVAEFEGHAAAGRGALSNGDPSTATAELSAALALWRGDALADCRGGGWAAAEAVRLDELRLSTVEDRIDADLMLGRHVMLVAELEALVVRHPLRERLWGALMLALYRAGRPAEAVRAYQRARDMLVDQLGLEPSPDLRRLDAAILSADPALDLDHSIVGGGSASRRGPGGSSVPLPGRISAASSAAFVGRRRERAVLSGAFEAVREGGVGVALVAGEPGIGKTSLSAAFAVDASTSGAIVLYGRCGDDLRIPYQPWTEVLTHLVDHAPAAVVAAHVEARGSELARLAPELGRRTSLRASTSDAESERYLLFGAVVDLLARVSELAPIVLVLDDLHWADRPSLQLLRHVVSAAGPRRLLVIGLYRDSDVTADHPLVDVLAASHREPDMQRLTLSGLGHDELLALLETTARHAMAEEGLALRDALLVETDGNPFFVGELLRHLRETGALYEDEHGDWLASPDLRASGLPMSIREVIGSRVARLGASTERALSLAAVIGREFDVDVLAGVAAIDEDALLDLCDRAVSAAVLTEGDRAGRYTFTHALIEHALHDDLSAGRRARAHQAIAEVLEELCGDDPGESIGELALHWAHAPQPQNATKAIAYAQRAGDRALLQLAPEEAMVRYRDGLDLLDRESPDDPARRAALLLGLGEAQRQTGDAAHRETLLAAGRLADDIGAVDLLVRAALRNNRGFNSIGGATDRERVELLTCALTQLGPSDSPDRARLLALLCVERNWDATFDERLSLATEAVDIARRTGDKAALVDAIRLSHESITMPQTLKLRLRWNMEACDLADELGDPTARLHANDYRCYAAVEAGDIETVRTAHAIFEAEATRIGQPQHWWQIAYNRASQCMLRGDLVAAEQSATEAVTLGSEAGFPEDAFTFYAAQLMSLRWMQGRADEIVPMVEQALKDNPGLEIYRAVHAFAKSFDDLRDEVRQLLDIDVAEDLPMFPDGTWLAGQVLWAGAVAQSGHRAGAAILYERLLPWHDQFASAHLNSEGSVALYLGLLARTLDRDAEADQWFQQALAMHEAMETPFFISWTQVAWAEFLADRNRPGDAQRARALADAALPVAAHRGFGYVERDAKALLNRL